MIIDPQFQTPLPVCQMMVDMVPEAAGSILEPTPGQGNIIEALKNKGFSDITAAADFFLLDQKLRFDCVVMNPPFSAKTGFLDNAPADEIKGMRLGYYILKQCMSKSDNIIALMPWFTLTDSDVRLRYLKKFGIKSLTSLPRKTFEYARIQTVVIELQKGFTGETIFKTFDF